MNEENDKLPNLLDLIGVFGMFLSIIPVVIIGGVYDAYRFCKKLWT